MSDSKLSGVRVKPLLWNKNDEALVVSRIYRVWKIHNSDKWLVNTNGYTLGGVLDGQYNRMFGSKVEAKVAAQNHYQAAIGEPIKPAQPDPVGYALAIEQAAQVAVNRHSHWHKLGSDCLVDDDVSACADIANAIRALITDRDRDDLAAHVAAEVAKARDAALVEAADIILADNYDDPDSAANAILALRDKPAPAVDNPIWSGEVCDGCGTSNTLAQIKGKNPKALSCCPERKMRPLTREDYDRLYNVAATCNGMLLSLDGNRRCGWDLNVPWYEDWVGKIRRAIAGGGDE